MADYICPVCSKKLIVSGKSLACPDGHNFDISKKGYVNLLISSHQNKNHGDNKLMVQSRKDFLETGYYDSLRNEIGNALKKYLKANPVILDAGCGECYYTEKAAEIFPEGEIFGVDISKEAVSMGVRRNPRLKCAVASVFDMPFEDEKFDCLLSVFSPYSGEEYNRVLKKGGIMIMVIPGREHLFGLKKLIYDEPYKNEVKSYELTGFDFLEKISVKYEMKITDKKVIHDLFMMTPYYYKTGRVQQERAENAEELITDAEFEILIYKSI